VDGFDQDEAMGGVQQSSRVARGAFARSALARAGGDWRKAGSSMHRHPLAKGSPRTG